MRSAIPTPWSPTMLRRLWEWGKHFGCSIQFYVISIISSKIITLNGGIAHVIRIFYLISLKILLLLVPKFGKSKMRRERMILDSSLSLSSLHALFLDFLTTKNKLHHFACLSNFNINNKDSEFAYCLTNFQSGDSAQSRERARWDGHARCRSGPKQLHSIGRRPQALSRHLLEV